MPDIDLDFPRDIREQLIIAVTERYGREHASLVAAFSTYRARGAIRDVGKALGLPFAELERLARVSDGWNARKVAEELALLPEAERRLLSPRWRAFAELTREIAGLPRHVSQHPGGMVISSRPLVELVPVQPAAMTGRQLCQWDKDSCSDAGFLKIDLLGLGMLSAVEDCVEQIAAVYGQPIDLTRIPLDDRDVYAEIQRADTVGDFQIESRAQMQSLLRTKPENLDDLTVQVALVRPGRSRARPCTPYIDARERLRSTRATCRRSTTSCCASRCARRTASSSSRTRCSRWRWRSPASRSARRKAAPRDEPEAERGGDRGVPGAVRRGGGANGVDSETADRVYDKLAAFSGFGFPKSHAAAFGLLAYQSAWLRHHYPAEFLCALLNAQPMGFYPPASLVRDAQRRGVEVRPPDVNLSETRCTWDEGAVRLGLRYVKSVGEDDAEALVAEREANGPYLGVGDLARRVLLDARELEALLAAAPATAGESGATSSGSSASSPATQTVRREHKQLTLELDPTVATPELPDLTVWERMLADYAATSVSIDVHPLTLLRPHLPADVLPSDVLNEAPHRSRVAFAGMAVARQRPRRRTGSSSCCSRTSSAR